MGRKKGDSFRKCKLKVVHRVRAPWWTISETTLENLASISKSLGVRQSRIVEIAINKILTDTSHIPHKPEKIDQLFTKN